eukprot:5614602-Amphidinium_carterae.1
MHVHFPLAAHRPKLHWPMPTSVMGGAERQHVLHVHTKGHGRSGCRRKPTLSHNEADKPEAVYNKFINLIECDLINDEVRAQRQGSDLEDERVECHLSRIKPRTERSE